MNNNNMQPVLTTDRLILNSFTLDDASEIQSIHSDKLIASTTRVSYPYKLGYAKEWIQTHEKSFKQGEGVIYAIRNHDKLSLIGCISLIIDPKNDIGELGYWIRKEEWNKGYCTEAGKSIIQFGFEHLNLNKIYADHIVRNPASGKVLQKLGFKKEGILKQHFKKWGIYEDIAVYGLCRSDDTP